MGRQVRRAIYGHTLTEKFPVFLMWTAKGALLDRAYVFKGMPWGDKNIRLSNVLFALFTWTVAASQNHLLARMQQGAIYLLGRQELSRR